MTHTTAQRGWLTILVAALIAGVACSTASTPTAPTMPVAEATDAATPIPTPTPTPTPAPPTARYHVTFDGTWSASSHPLEFPSSAHFSPLIGATHTAQVGFWHEGGAASDGIIDMAERGLTTRLSNEISAAIAAGTAERLVTGGNIGSSPGSAFADFEISQAQPLVTLVSMIAPSPDWFVGVSGIPLFQNGEWASERRFDLAPWDAGSDGGVTFSSPDLPLTPRPPITRILTAPLSPSGRVTSLGTFTFTRVS
ncbi:MAG: spondin domain-containing protein [Vicinamibacterales bacterium]